MHPDYRPIPECWSLPAPLLLSHPGQRILDVGDHMWVGLLVPELPPCVHPTPCPSMQIPSIVRWPDLNHCLQMSLPLAFSHFSSPTSRPECRYVLLVAQSCPCSLQPHGLQPARLLCPWNSPGKDTGVGCHSLLQEIFPIQESNLGLPQCRQILSSLSHQGSPYSITIISPFLVGVLCVSKPFRWSSDQPKIP